MSGKHRVEFMQLTGQPHASVGLAKASFVADKRYQLLSYLAYQGEWVGRDRLAFLFWPDTDSANSRQNLRGLLRRLQSLPFEAGIEVTPHQLRWEIPSDLALYRAALTAGEQDDAVAAYHGPLLTGLEGDDSGEFDEWLEIERERLHADWRALALQRVNACTAGEHQVARALVERLLAVDPLDEEVVRTFLESASRTGQVEDARAVHQVFVSRLGKEMGLEPTSATMAAFERLELLVRSAALPAAKSATDPAATAAATAAARAAAQPADQSAATPVLAPTVAAVGPGASRARVARMPAPATTFVGRERELAQVTERLAEGACRLLTLVGPGGVGKTRLALAAALRMEGRFAGGTVFVPLDATSTAEEVPQVLAEALGVGRSGGSGEDVMVAVERALAGTELLLVMDNFEHLPNAVALIPRLLAASDGVKVLVTSRERLGLQAEWLYPVEGLAFPEAPSSLDQVSVFDAVTLFVERAQRVNPSFTVRESDVASLVRLFSLVEGMPLAIELAASWARALPLADIATDVSSSLDTLRTAATDGTPRHVSIRATFEQTWRILGEPERGALMRLAVFRAAIRSPAAQFVAGASHAVLAALVDKSLVRLREDGRYSLHPLLRAFSLEKLRAEPTELDRAERRHAAFYLRFLRERTDAARGPRPAAVLAEIDSVLPELLAAARTAKERGKGTQLVAFMRLLAVDTGYLPARGYGPERLELLVAAGDVAVANGWLDAAHDLRGRLADAYATHFGEPRKALAVYEEAVALARRAEDIVREAVFTSMIGATRFSIDGSGATELDAALDLAESAGDGLCLATVLEHRAYVRAVQEQWQESGELYRRSLALVDEIEEGRNTEPYEVHRRRYYAHISLGEVEQQLGRFDESVAARREALRIAEASGNPIWTAHAFLELGEMYGGVGDDDLARECLTQALVLYRENHVTAHLERLRAVCEAHGYEMPMLVTTT